MQHLALYKGDFSLTSAYKIYLLAHQSIAFFSPYFLEILGVHKTTCCFSLHSTMFGFNTCCVVSLTRNVKFIPPLISQKSPVHHWIHNSRITSFFSVIFFIPYNRISNIWWSILPARCSFRQAYFTHVI